MSKILAFDFGVFLEKNNSANAMIRQDFVRAFERGVIPYHMPNIELNTDSSQVFRAMEDSSNVSVCFF